MSVRLTRQAIQISAPSLSRLPQREIRPLGPHILSLRSQEDRSDSGSSISDTESSADRSEYSQTAERPWGQGAEGALRGRRVAQRPRFGGKLMQVVAAVAFLALREYFERQFQDGLASKIYYVLDPRVGGNFIEKGIVLTGLAIGEWVGISTFFQGWLNYFGLSQEAEGCL